MAALTLATTMLYSKGVRRNALDIALPAVDHQALAVGDDVLNRHAAARLCAHDSAPLTAKLGCNLFSFCFHDC